jgi:lipopolysaccharide transport system ATP-binding protein
MSVAIKAEHLSKKFVIDHESQEKYTALRDVMTHKARKLFSSPFSKNKTRHTTEDFWAVDDINFEINEGDRIGIIGRNGAGKSTLLKLLSRITEPTKGRITLRGRVASLLEVGTGFHPELTGRENIFLNGAILGMNRAEIRRKFDEIVAFAEVEKFLDTPVKKYSSGMYVRLAFAVAAHLEPEILIVDEVLAVGDAQFQKKCLGKMEDVSKGGRTVIFVSHNMTAIQSLCNKGLFMSKGRLLLDGPIDACIKEYLENGIQMASRYEPGPKDLQKSEHVKIVFAELYKNKVGSKVELPMLDDSVLFYVRFRLEKRCVLNLSLVLWTQRGDCVFNVCTKEKSYEEGEFESTLTIPANFLNDEVYGIELYFVEDTSKVLLRVENMLVFEMHEPTRDTNWYDKWIGVIRPQLDFKISAL